MKKVALALLALLVISPSNGFSKEQASLYPGFPQIQESKAYKKFIKRPVSDFSKILYLIDRYADADIDIIYDGQTYTAVFATTVARWFLARKYKKQSPEEWINRWCNRSVVTNKLVYVKLPDGKYRVAKEILLEELAVLEETLRIPAEIQSVSSEVVAKVVDVAVTGSVAANPLNQKLASAQTQELTPA